MRNFAKLGETNKVHDIIGVTFLNKYKLIVKVKNETDHELRWVTTDDFILQDKQNEQPIDEMEVRKYFPHD